MPCAAAQCEAAGRQRLRRHRHAAQPFRARGQAMSMAEETRPPLWRRLWAFALEIWDVLRRPSSVFGLGTLVLAGFIAGIMFWGAFNTALELTNTEPFCTSCHEMRSNVFEEL